jgi:protein-S-isoprenylcysteine O-methyltransferase Ste14
MIFRSEILGRQHTMPLLLLSITLVAELCAIAATAFSMLYPQKRVWPPPRLRSWQAAVMCSSFNIAAVGVVATGIIDWGYWRLGPWIRWGLGACLWLAGNGLALWGTVALGLARTYGNDGALVQRGPYRFSRNPQYVGFMAGLIGWPLVSSSPLTVLAGLVGIVA